MNYYIIVLGLLVVGGLATTVWGVKGWCKTRRVAMWPTTEGTIESSNPQSTDDDLLPEIIYRYDVNGTPYSSGLTLPSGTLPSEQLSKRLALDYPVGGKVAVRYDPVTPSTSVVEGAQGKSGDIFIIFLGVASTVFGILAIIQGV